MGFVTQIYTLPKAIYQFIGSMLLPAMKLLAGSLSRDNKPSDLRLVTKLEFRGLEKRVEFVDFVVPVGRICVPIPFTQDGIMMVVMQSM